MRANFGSTGSLANFWPIGVSLPELSSALTSCKVFKPSRIILSSGGSTKGKSRISPNLSDAICKITADKLVRLISGSVNSGRLK